MRKKKDIIYPEAERECVCVVDKIFFLITHKPT